MELYFYIHYLQEEAKAQDCEQQPFNCMGGNICMMTGQWPFSPSFPVIIFTTTATSFSYFRLTTTIQTVGPIYGISATLNCWKQNHFLNKLNLKSRPFFICFVTSRTVAVLWCPYDCRFNNRNFFPKIKNFRHSIPPSTSISGFLLTQFPIFFYFTI